MHNYKFYLFLLIFGIVFSSCEKTDDTVIDPVLNIPKILSATVTPASYDTVNINGVVTATVTSDVPVTSVIATIKNPDGQVIGTVELKDNGVAPDPAAGDGNFTGIMQITLACKLVGSYSVGVIAVNNSGLSSNQFNVSFAITNINNHRPFLTNLICPDSLRRPSGNGADTVNFAFLQVRGNDPDGDCDVKQAYFNSYKPDGSPNLFNPFTMYDDGNVIVHGDTTAGDFKFSLIVKITADTSSTSVGNYTFKFFAVDQQNLVSDTLTHLINIYR